ncbi:uncharacterized protein LOC110694928 [Chenopodium quinoa]|uniref:uncharacterized protein LOC110694928 n=1 Tax=Chenopodium quinoa TaxID=63459 RepID=UPI000B7719D1|nr:uncharacterized protein LOC110694928 [Chenopodium quinoa]
MIEAADVDASVNLMNVQKKLNFDPHNEVLVDEEKQARVVFQKAHAARYSYLKQKSKMHWVKEGDLNTDYFHAFIQKRRVQNRICSVIHEDQTIQEPSMVVNAFLEFYQNLLGTSSEPEKTAHNAVIGVGRILSQEQQIDLCKSFTEHDVKAALWIIEDDKAPGPDGFSSKFFKVSWDIVKSDICEAVLSFFNHGCLLKQVNNTLLTMVPKVEDVIYVSYENQSAFVAGRSILDNILVCQDMLKNYNNKRKAPRCTVKVDLRKAYDSVHWSFIRDMMMALNFPPQFVRWVMECVTTPSYSVMINVKGMKSFSLLVRALKTFEKVSGLVANSEKTAVYCGSMDSVKKEEILGGYGFAIGDFPFRYLGISLNTKYMRSSDFDSIVDKMLARITCWSSRNLSYAAKTILINSALMSLHSYRAQCVLLPNGVMHRITQLCRSFLWDGVAVLGGAPLISWDWVCKPKKYGGIGMRDCIRWNKAALGKYVWKIAKKEDTLWVKWVHSIYLKDRDWWSYSPTKCDGWFWRWLCAVKDELQQGTCLKIIATLLGINKRNFRLDMSWKHWNRQGLDMIQKKIFLAVFSACVYYIWFTRNHVFWDKAVIIPSKLSNSICLEVLCRLQQLIDKLLCLSARLLVSVGVIGSVQLLSLQSVSFFFRSKVLILCLLGVLSAVVYCSSLVSLVLKAVLLFLRVFGCWLD